MDKTTLVEIDIEGGERLLKALDKADLDIRAALWFYFSDSDKWRLIIAFPLVDQEGPRKAYTLIQSELAKLVPPSRISLEDISAVGLKHHIIQALWAMVREHPDPAIISTISKKWFTRTVMNGVFIEAAYIYRVSSKL